MATIKSTNHAFLISTEDPSLALKTIEKLTIDFIPDSKSKKYHPDVLKIDSLNTRSIGIDQIRELKNQLAYKPYQADYKVAIIEEADKLTIEAQNALLKTLEEPPRATILILATSNYGLLLPTIISRCQLFFPGRGSESEVDLDTAFSIVNLSLSEKFSQAEKAAENSQNWLKEQALAWRQLLLLKIGAKRQIQKLKLKDQSEKISSSQIKNFLKKIQTTHQLISHNVNSKLALEILLLDAPNDRLL